MLTALLLPTHQHTAVTHTSLLRVSSAPAGGPLAKDPATRTDPNGSTRVFGYDRFDRTVRMPWRKTSDSSVLADIAYGYDRASRRTWRQDLTPAAQAAFDRAYGYDTLGQVTAADRGTLNDNRTGIGGIPEQAESWLYDQQGNWDVYQNAEPGSVPIRQIRRHNPSNQIQTLDGTNAGVAFDQNGNMTRIATGDPLTGPPRTLIWNAWDQLIEVRDASNVLLQRNTYDAIYRRTTRQPGSGPTIHTYYNLEWRPVEEGIFQSSSFIIHTSSIYGIRHRDDLVRRDRDTTGSGTLNESLWCLMDYFDPIAILDATGAVQERYTYPAFGVPLILAPDYSARTTSSVAWDFLFHGQFTDAETGYQNYGYRFYLPDLGRWLSRDPIGEIGGENLYHVTDNALTNGTDLLGVIEPDTPGLNFPSGEYKDRPYVAPPERGGVRPPYKPGGHRGFHHYGNWGGPGWSNGYWVYEADITPPYVDPVDLRDACYRGHDLCINQCPKCPKDVRSKCIKICDHALAASLRWIGVDGPEPFLFDTLIPGLLH